MFLPFTQFEIKTKLSPSEIEEKLSQIIGSESYAANPLDVATPYYGDFNPHYFQMRRVRTLVKNDFAPVIRGYITEEEGITQVKVKMRFKNSTLVFFGFVLLFFGFMLASAPKSISLPFSGGFLLFYSFSLFIFHLGGADAKERLEELLVINQGK